MVGGLRRRHEQREALAGAPAGRHGDRGRHPLRVTDPQQPEAAALVARLAPGTSDVADVVVGGITFEMRVTLQGGIDGLV